MDDRDKTTLSSQFAPLNITHMLQPITCQSCVCNNCITRQSRVCNNLITSHISQLLHAQLQPTGLYAYNNQPHTQANLKVPTHYPPKKQRRSRRYPYQSTDRSAWGMYQSACPLHTTNISSTSPHFPCPTVFQTLLQHLRTQCLHMNSAARCSAQTAADSPHAYSIEFQVVLCDAQSHLHLNHPGCPSQCSAPCAQWAGPTRGRRATCT
jgi:hypothetical protein